MLELVPRRGLSRRYTVQRDGQDVADFTLARFGEAVKLRIEGVAHELRRERLLSGPFTLSRGGAVIARAHKPGAFRYRFDVEYEGRAYEVAKVTVLKRRFDVRVDGRTIGSITPHHLFTRRSSIDLPADLGLPAIVFIAALVTLMWEREANNAVVSSSS